MTALMIATNVVMAIVAVVMPGLGAALALRLDVPPPGPGGRADWRDPGPRPA